MMTLSQIIIYGTPAQLAAALKNMDTVDYMDEYGFTPLIQTGIVNNFEMAKLLIEYGADPNLQDLMGNTVLHWAVENSNQPFIKFLLTRGANPNIGTRAAESPLAKPLLRRQRELIELLIQHGANIQFAQDYINTKLTAHRFALAGYMDIVTAQGTYKRIEYEGFYLEFTLALIRHSLEEYRNNFAARPLRKVFDKIHVIIDALKNASELIRYQQYLIKVDQYRDKLHPLCQKQPLIVPVSQEGHAFCFVNLGDLLVRCDRSQSETFLDNVVMYRMRHKQAWNSELITQLIYEKNKIKYIDTVLPKILGLEKLFALDIDKQVAGNCSWANIEAAVPALFFLLSMQAGDNLHQFEKHQEEALCLFQQWREWDKDRALHWSVENFYEANLQRQTAIAGLLGSILFQSLKQDNPQDLERARKILPILRREGFEYILEDYFEFFCNRKKTPQGKNLKAIIRLCDESYYEW